MTTEQSVRGKLEEIGNEVAWLASEVEKIRYDMQMESMKTKARMYDLMLNQPKSERTESGEQPTGKSTTPTCESGDDEITLDMIGAGMLAHLRHGNANVKEIVITVYRAMRAAR
jgi:hypothetical protein